MNTATIVINLDTPEGIVMKRIDVILSPTNNITDNMYNVQRAAEQLVASSFQELHKKCQRNSKPQ